MDTWGYSGVIGYLRLLLRGQELPLDAKQSDIMFFISEYLDGNKTVAWKPTRVQFVGPGCPAQDTVFRKDRVTVVFGVIKDGRRVIEDISLG